MVQKDWIKTTVQQHTKASPCNWLKGYLRLNIFLASRVQSEQRMASVHDGVDCS
jgi:hypothetical protein